ncbi:MAG: T9SS type A sorting domain-containing protein [Bacteroidetes bacterium]|nr:T9SS type A sorting domain-containing protein [Bacteroidota bacterium]
MKTNLPAVKLFSRTTILIFECLTFTNLFSQQNQLKVFEDFNTSVGTQHFFQKSVTRTDANHYGYMAGATYNTANGNYDMLVAKVSPAGALVWARSFNGAGNGDDDAADVRIDANGNVYITGSVYQNAADSNDAIIRKYDSNGNLLWSQIYNGASSHNDGTVNLVLTTNFVYAVGSTYAGSTNNYDFLALKYSTAGTFQWAGTWNDANLNDGGVRATVNNNFLTVAGAAQTTSLKYKYAVVKFRVSDGLVQNSHTSGGNQAIAFDKITDLQEDASENIYVTGGVMNSGQGFDYRTEKLDSALTQQWAVTYNGAANLDDIASGIYLDSLNNVIVTGFSTTTSQGKNYVTIKYDNSGNQQWVSSFNGAANGNDSATAIAVKGTDRIYVTGYSFNGTTNDYYTLRYDGNGNLVWQINFNSIVNGNDQATDIANDVPGVIWVVGQTAADSGKFQYTTVRYIEKGVTLVHDTITATSSSFVFTENKDQLLNTNGAAIPQEKFYTIHGAPNVYFSDTAISYVFAKLDSSSAHHDTLARVDMKYENANANLKVRSMEVRDDYENFFLGHIPEGRSYVRNYDKLIDFEVWNNVDVMYGSNLRGLKTYFICKPGGGGNSATEVDLKFEGADSVRIDYVGELHIYTQLGEIIQPRPAAWQIDAGGNFVALNWQPFYSMIGVNEISFSNFGSFNTALPLVIATDWGHLSPQNIQNIEWSSYYGAGGNNLKGEFRDVKVTKDGHVLVCGFSNAFFFPLSTPHFYGPSSLGGSDGTVVKFKKSGEREWATFYGGNIDQSGSNYAFDEVTSVDEDSVGNVFFTGNTQSTDFPLHHWGSAYYDSTNTCTGGGCVKSDVFLAQLDASGQNQIWSTYYGGNGTDYGLKLRVSKSNGNIYVVGICESDFPLDSSSAYWNSHYGNGFILRFNAVGVRKWATKIGSADSPTIFSDNTVGLVIDKSGDIVVTGAVVDANGFPIKHNLCTDSSNVSFPGGVLSAYVTKFTGETNDLVWSTFYGEQIEDYSWNVIADSSLNYYITGQTFAGNVLHLVNPGGGAYFQNSGGGGKDAFIAEFDNNGCLIWSTLYGGSGNEQGFALAIDSLQNLYLAGNTSSNNLPFANPNLSSAYVDATYNFSGDDGFINCFQNGTHQQIWTTYFGRDIIFPWALATSSDTTLYFAGQVIASGPGAIPLDNGGGPPVWYQDTVNAFTGWITRFDINPTIVGIPELSSANQLSLNIFPNPSQNVFWIAGNINTAYPISIEVFDLLGQAIYSENISPCSVLRHEINLENCSNGIYVVHLKTGEKIFTQKIIIQR